MDSIPYKIGFRRGDFEIILQGDKDWVELKFKDLMSREFEVKNLEKQNINPANDTLGEFLDRKGNPEKHTDVVAIFAYWNFKKEGLEAFNVKDIINAYDKTRRPKPSNPNQIINQNVSTHIFAEAKEKKDNLKAWVITRTGENYVEQLGAIKNGA